MSGYDIPTPDAVANPGLIVRASIGGQDRVFQFEGFVDRDVPQSDLDELCDKIARAADRQKAKYELPGLRRQLEGVEFKTADNRARLAAVQAMLDHYSEQRNQKTVEREKSLSDVYTTARDQHFATGRRGEFKPQGAVAGTMSRLKAEIDELQRPAKEEAEYEAQKAQLENEIRDGNRAIEQLKVLIGEAEALSRGEDISGVEAAKEG